jgi:hypothetical protein
VAACRRDAQDSVDGSESTKTQSLSKYRDRDDGHYIFVGTNQWQGFRAVPSANAMAFNGTVATVLSSIGGQRAGKAV